MSPEHNPDSAGPQDDAIPNEQGNQSAKLELEVSKLRLETAKLLREAEKLSLEISDLKTPFWKKKELFGFAATLVTMIGIAVNIHLSSRNFSETMQRQQAKHLLALMGSSQFDQRANAGRMLSQLDGRYNFDELMLAHSTSVATAKSPRADKDYETPFHRVGIVEALALETSGWAVPLTTRLGIVKAALRDVSPLVRSKAVEGIVRSGQTYLDDVTRLWVGEQDVLRKATQVREEYGAHLIRIPAGLAVLGSDAHDRREAPAREEWVEAFWIDKQPVTNAQWSKVMGNEAPAIEHFANGDIVGEANARARSDWRKQNPDHPVVGVTFERAKAYCHATGGRSLPTEIQWEAAVRGRSGWLYPWGVDKETARALIKREMDELSKPESWQAPVRLSRGVSADIGQFGVAVAVSGVRQWTRSEWSDRYRIENGKTLTEDCKQTCVVRGAAGRDSDDERNEQRFRTTRRIAWSATEMDDNLGFRCAVDVSSAKESKWQ